MKTAILGTLLLLTLSIGLAACTLPAGSFDPKNSPQVPSDEDAHNRGGY